jgi:tetratricopeptide (TPR) repeat protein
MWRRTLLLLILFPAILSWARDKQENWLEVRSQHFSVLTNANEKTGRRIADQFERMRAVFHFAFPKISIDNFAPIVVLAVKDDNDFRALEPQVYLAKGQVKLDGLFLRVPDKNYVLMRTDAEGDHPYAVIYHEYTHLLSSKASEWMPLWVNEGLAEYYETTEIHENNIALGKPSSENLALLRQSKLLPLPTLFVVDYNSPYYHEQNRASIFYAESWALTHYLQINDLKDKTDRLGDYLELVSRDVDPVTAGTRAFGDLNQLQAKLEAYIRQERYTYYGGPANTNVDDASFKVQSLTAPQVDAVRADFLAYVDRTADSHALLDRVLKDDPNNVQAHETMGYLAFRAGHSDEARTWYQQAVKLDSHSYLAHYYFAAISMNIDPTADDPQIEASLRTAIKLNPSFAPAYERLAALLGSHHRNLQEAYMMALTASQIEPGNVSYRLTAANVLMLTDRTKDAVTVLQNALKIAKSPEDKAAVQSMLARVEQYNSAREQQKAFNARAEADWKQQQANAAATTVAEPTPTDEPPPQGAHHIVLGKLQNVQCHTFRIDLSLAAKAKTIAMHNPNYSKIQYSALGFTPKGPLDPCKDLEGSTAKVDYADSPDSSGSAYVFAIEVHK